MKIERHIEGERKCVFIIQKHSETERAGSRYIILHTVLHRNKQSL